MVTHSILHTLPLRGQHTIADHAQNSKALNDDGRCLSAATTLTPNRHHLNALHPFRIPRQEIPCCLVLLMPPEVEQSRLAPSTHTKPRSLISTDPILSTTDVYDV
eukprot:scaffold25569_cov57-Cyclotella_meneghiniana.AAC.5